jgi:magnesium-transporting ATPase (P-type)
LILENFDDRILQILCVAAVVSTAMGIYQDGWEHGWYEGVTILLAICIIVSVTAGNNYMKEL